MKLHYRIEDIDSVANSILKELNVPAILCFNGPMGVGKTTLIKALIKELGVVDSGSSPTFSFVNEYADTKGQIIAYHFDFYRIENESEALDLGIEDYFESGKWVFVEWPERISSLIPAKSIKLNMYFIDKNEHFIDNTVRFVEMIIS